MFAAIEKNSVVFLRSDMLGDAVHGFSTRAGGVSTGAQSSLNLDERYDTAENVQENFRRLCGAVGSDVSRVVLSRQVHRDDVRLITAADCGKGLWRERDYDSADALICNVPGISLVVFSADCNVILLYDPVHQAIGAAHAGWRGTAMGIAGKTAEEMVRSFGCRPEHIRAAIGPAIGACCFETDGDVPAALHDAMGHDAESFMEKRGTKWHVDLKGVNRWWLQKAGVRCIDICSHCTACHPELYWSHRKMGTARGEQVAIIALREEQL